MLEVVERYANTVRAVTKYPNKESSPQELNRWGRSFGVNIHETGLVLPSPHKEDLDRKITPNFTALSERVAAERKAGKAVLVLPGGFDLVHAGHMSFAIQSRQFLADSMGITPDEVFVVALLDDDDLLRETKRGAYRRITGKDGPIEGGFINGRHPRLDAMASLPVDAVCLIPSPSSQNLPEPASVDTATALNNFSATSPLWHSEPQSARNVANALLKYPNLSLRIRTGERIEYSDPVWSVEVWMLYLMASLNRREVEGETFERPVTRVVSMEDKDYLGIVSELMTAAKIEAKIIDDIFCLSSKNLVDRYGVEYLLDVKKMPNEF